MFRYVTPGSTSSGRFVRSLPDADSSPGSPKKRTSVSGALSKRSSSARTRASNSMSAWCGWLGRFFALISGGVRSDDQRPELPSPALGRVPAPLPPVPPPRRAKSGFGASSAASSLSPAGVPPPPVARSTVPVALRAARFAVSSVPATTSPATAPTSSTASPAPSPSSPRDFAAPPPTSSTPDPTPAAIRSTISGFWSMVFSTRSKILATLSSRTFSSACASTPLISSATWRMKTSAPTFSFKRSSTSAWSETRARSSSTSRLISSTSTTGTSSRTSGSCLAASRSAAVPPLLRSVEPCLCSAVIVSTCLVRSFGMRLPTAFSPNHTVSRGGIHERQALEPHEALERRIELTRAHRLPVEPRQRLPRVPPAGRVHGDLHLVGPELDDVVGGRHRTPEAQARDSARVDHAHAHDAPHIGDVPVTREHHVDLELAQEAHHIARFPKAVAVAPGPWPRQDVVVDDEDPRSAVPAAELCVDPAVVLASHFPLVEIRLGGVEGYELRLTLGHRDRLSPLAGAEEILEIPVADVPRVVIPHDDNDVGATEPVEVAADLLELVSVAVGGQIAGDGHQIGRESVGLLDRRGQQIRFEESRADVDI